MRKILTLILTSVSFLAFAQENIDLSRSVDDNGQELLIRVIGHSNGKYIDYARTFNIEGLSKAERVAIADKVMDSLGVTKIEDPIASLPAASIALQAPEISKDAVSVKASRDYTSQHAAEKKTTKSTVGGLKKAFTKEIWLDENGFLHLRYSFSKGADEYIFEKSTDASDKSESERQKFIEAFEEEIALPAI